MTDKRGFLFFFYCILVSCLRTLFRIWSCNISVSRTPLEGVCAQVFQRWAESLSASNIVFGKILPVEWYLNIIPPYHAGNWSGSWITNWSLRIWNLLSFGQLQVSHHRIVMQAVNHPHSFRCPKIRMTVPHSFFPSFFNCWEMWAVLDNKLCWNIFMKWNWLSTSVLHLVHVYVMNKIAALILISLC